MCLSELYERHGLHGEDRLTLQHEGRDIFDSERLDRMEEEAGLSVSLGLIPQKPVFDKDVIFELHDGSQVEAHRIKRVWHPNHDEVE